MAAGPPPPRDRGHAQGGGAAPLRPGSAPHALGSHHLQHFHAEGAAHSLLALGTRVNVAGVCHWIG